VYIPEKLVPVALQMADELVVAHALGRFRFCGRFFVMFRPAATPANEVLRFTSEFCDIRT
jgi:hypothetical protein